MELTWDQWYKETVELYTDEIDRAIKALEDGRNEGALNVLQRAKRLSYARMMEVD